MSHKSKTISIMKDNITRILHWGFACFIIVILGIGFYMTNTEYSPYLYQMHKSLGVFFSLLIGVRIYWRIRHPWKSTTLENKYERKVRSVTYRLFMLLFFFMPILGLMCSAFSGFGVHLFDIEIIPQNLNLEGKVKPFNSNFYEVSKFLHKLLAKIFAALILLHISGILKHHFINKNNTLIRMLNNKKKNQIL